MEQQSRNLARACIRGVLVVSALVTAAAPLGGCIRVHQGRPTVRRQTSRRVVPVSQLQDSKRTMHLKQTRVGVWVWIRSYTTCVRKVSVTTTTVTRTNKRIRGSLILGYSIGGGVIATAGVATLVSTAKSTRGRSSLCWPCRG